MIMKNNKDDNQNLLPKVMGVYVHSNPSIDLLSNAI